jgi:hypothetical protein
MSERSVYNEQKKVLKNFLGGSYRAFLPIQSGDIQSSRLIAFKLYDDDWVIWEITQSGSIQHHYDTFEEMFDSMECLSPMKEWIVKLSRI